MKPVIARGLALGKGLPKICVPVTGRTREEILAQAAAVVPEIGRSADLAEWRLDFYAGVFNPAELRKTAVELRSILGGLPVLATFRTSREGGVCPCSEEEYEKLLTDVCSLPVDLLDLELFTGEATLRRLTELARENGLKTVFSNHDFTQTPPAEELTARLLRMEALGADIAKIAVMPQTPQDVFNLLSASRSCADKMDIPVISISMGSLGAVSRVCGSLSGSCLTFGTIGSASAPGQLPSRQLKHMLESLTY